MNLRTRAWAAGLSSMSIAAATAQHISTTNPATKDPVSARRYPNAYGPAKPARLASALIVPTATADLESLRISVGIAQNTDRNAMSTQIMLNTETVITVELDTLIRHENPVAAMNNGNAACQRLSRSLSECHPFNNIARRAPRRRAQRQTSRPAHLKVPIGF